MTREGSIEILLLEEDDCSEGSILPLRQHRETPVQYRMVVSIPSVASNATVRGRMWGIYILLLHSLPHLDGGTGQEESKLEAL